MFEKNQNGRNNNRTFRPRNEAMTFELTKSFISTADNELDADAIKSILQGLANDGVFSVISVPVQISRALLTGDAEKRGNMNVGYISAVDSENNRIEVVIYASSVASMKELMKDTKIIVNPRILAHDDEFTTFLSFDFKAFEEEELYTEE